MVFVLSGGVLSTVFIPDTEEVTGSIPVAPTSTRRDSEQPKRGSEFFCINPCVATFFCRMVPCVTSSKMNGFQPGTGAPEGQWGLTA